MLTNAQLLPVTVRRAQASSHNLTRLTILKGSHAISKDQVVPLLIFYIR